MRHLSPIDISVVIPVYNAQSTLRELVERIDHVFKQNHLSPEIVLIDDGSEDKSWEVILNLKKQFGEKITAIRLKKNFGQHNAIRCGFEYARGTDVVTMDDDLQHLPEEIPRLFEKRDETAADVVYGLYDKARHGLLRRVTGYMARRSFDVFTHTHHRGSSFRLLRKGAVDAIRRHKENFFLFIDDVLHSSVRNIAHVLVVHHPSPQGKSSYTLPKLAALYVRRATRHVLFAREEQVGAHKHKPPYVIQTIL